MNTFTFGKAVLTAAALLSLGCVASASTRPQTATPVMTFGVSLEDPVTIIELSRRGADDPAGHVRGGKGEHPAGHASLTVQPTDLIELSRRGADDPAGHVRGGKGEHPAGHASLTVQPTDLIELSRRGADDPAGHVRGGKGEHPAGHASLTVQPDDITVIGRRGRGKDDGPRHT